MVRRSAAMLDLRARTDVSDYAALATDVTIRRLNYCATYSCWLRILCHDLGC